MSASSGRERHPTDTDRHPAQWLAFAIGAAYLLIGIFGFAVTGFDGFAEPRGDLLFGVFEVNPLHNVVHLAIGLAGLAMWGRLDGARAYGWLLAIGYGAAFIYGLFVAGTDQPENVLALNEADNWLHAISALAGLGIALWPADKAVGADRRETDRSATRDRRR
jgi:hypothetical protein